MSKFSTVLFVLFLNSSLLLSQEVEIKESITSFFEVFHKKDVLNLKELCDENIKLTSILQNSDGTEIKHESAEQFYNGVQSIPDTILFEEKTFDFSIQHDDVFAHVWVPYEFYVNGKLSHRGHNSFHLMKKQNRWLIISITDSRIK
ncbi:MAG: nuclear transport factor 2 family protein [Flavobacterium sp.]